MYYSLITSHLIYACEIWGQNQTSKLFKKLLLLQGKALKLINFQIFNMFTPLGLNHAHNTRAATNHLPDIPLRQTIHLPNIPQRQTIHYGTYSITSIASSS